MEGTSMHQSQVHLEIQSAFRVHQIVKPIPTALTEVVILQIEEMAVIRKTLFEVFPVLEVVEWHVP